MTPLAADACSAFILNSIKVALQRSNLDLSDHRELGKVIPDLCRLPRAWFALIHSDDRRVLITHLPVDASLETEAVSCAETHTHRLLEHRSDALNSYDI